MNLREGTYLQNRYEILARIGSGGMSDVYKALDHKLERLVGIKVLKEEYVENVAFVNRFKMEAQASAGLEDPNIVNVYDVVDEGNLHYIVMELVNGITLKKHILKMGHLGIRESIAIASQVAGGLQAAHSKGIIHRDIKPQNVIITSDSKVKVADFGLAGANDTDSMNSVAMGSVEYISPEQAQGLPADARSDIYSLGITIYEMVTGQLPFVGDTTVSIALAQIEKDIPLPSSKNPLVPATLDQIILKCTQKRPERRYQNVQELIDDLRIAMMKSDINIRPENHENGATRMISQEELGKINTSVKINNSYKPNPPVKIKTREDYEKEDKNKKNKDGMIITLAVIIALVVIAVIVFAIGKGTGLFNGGNSEIQTESESVQEISDTQVPVPDVKGLSDELAKQRLHDSSLEIEYQYEHSDTEDNGVVLSQNPEADTVVDKYSKVTVIVSLGADGEDLSTLGLLGTYGEDVRTILLEKGYEVKLSEEYDAEYPAGTVCAINPMNPSKNGTVVLTISKGDQTAITKVPPLIGLPEEDAIALLAESGLVPGEVNIAPSENIAMGLVISQTVLPDTEISKGTAIGYTVSSGSAASYIASIDETCSIDYFDGPGADGQKIPIIIRLHQVVDGQDVFTELMSSRYIVQGTLIPVKFQNIEGAFGVDEGLVEVVKEDTGEILKSYPVEFFNVG